MNGSDDLTSNNSVAPSRPCHHLPRAEEFLYPPPWLRSYAYRMVDRLFANRTIRCGPQPQLFPRGPELALRLEDGSELDVGTS